MTPVTPRTVTITFLSRERQHVITTAEHYLILNHLSRAEAAAFVSDQYALPVGTAQAVVEAIHASTLTVTRLSTTKVEVHYPGEECTQEITTAEYNMLPSLTTVQATKFIRDQYQLGLYKAKRCADAARAMHSQANPPL